MNFDSIDDNGADEVTNLTVKNGMEIARQFVQRIDFADVQSGEWFFQLIRQVVNTNEKNARADYFQQKYPGMPADDITDILISVNSKYAAVAGGIAGVAITANQLTTIASAGMTATLWLSSMGVEMVYLSWLQIRLVADLAVIYDLQLDTEDPEDILMIFGYALGVTPTEFLGKGIQVAASTTARTAIKTYISKGTLKALQDFARRLGFKILQRTIIKYAIPAVSAAVGSGYNYMTTRSVGMIAKSHFSNRGKASAELRNLITRQYSYDIIFPAAIVYMAQVDGEFSQVERDLYKSILTRMSFPEHDQLQLQKLIQSEDEILSYIQALNDKVASQTLLDLLILMAVFDGKLVLEERQFLEKVAITLEIELDISAVENQAESYRIENSGKRWNALVETTSDNLKLAKERISDWFSNNIEQLRNQSDDTNSTE